MEQIQSSRGGSGRRRWICIQGLRSSGRVPGRWIYSVGFTSSTSTSVFCGSFKSFKAMGLQLIWGWRHPFWKTAGGGRRRQCPACKGPRVMVVFFSFFQGPLCKLSGGTAVLCILPECTYTCTGLCMVFLWLMQVRLIKKKDDVHVCYHSGS